MESHGIITLLLGCLSLLPVCRGTSLDCDFALNSCGWTSGGVDNVEQSPGVLWRRRQVPFGDLKYDEDVDGACLSLSRSEDGSIRREAVAVLYSPILKVSEENDRKQCFELIFHYHISSGSSAWLKVIKSRPGNHSGHNSVTWQTSGKTTRIWPKATVLFYEKQDFRIIITGSYGVDITGITMAIDSTTFTSCTGGRVTFRPPTEPVSSEGNVSVIVIPVVVGIILLICITGLLVFVHRRAKNYGNSPNHVPFSGEYGDSIQDLAGVPGVADTPSPNGTSVVAGQPNNVAHNVGVDGQQARGRPHGVGSSTAPATRPQGPSSTNTAPPEYSQHEQFELIRVGDLHNTFGTRNQDSQRVEPRGELGPRMPPEEPRPSPRQDGRPLVFIPGTTADPRPEIPPPSYETLSSLYV